jgi:hypothetical protein
MDHSYPSSRTGGTDGACDPQIRRHVVPIEGTMDNGSATDQSASHLVFIVKPKDMARSLAVRPTGKCPQFLDARLFAQKFRKSAADKPAGTGNRDASRQRWCFIGLA